MHQNTEIERKFLVDLAHHQDLSQYPGVFIKQGYLSSRPEQTVRIRIKGDQAFLTVKGETQGISRTEIETPIDQQAAEALFASFISHEVLKIRREVEFEGKIWEVDEFLGRHKGLWVAEIELSTEEEAFVKPLWLGREVSHEHFYVNAYLAENGLQGVALC
jgi:adenylate cyclase